MARRATTRHRPQRRRETLRNAAPSAPRPPSTPAGPAPLPVDPIYTGDIGAIDLNYGNTQAGINYDRTQIGQQYGYDQAGNLDPSNPFSIAQNLERRYHQEQSGTLNSNASRGQLYSGANQRQLDEGTFRYKRDEDAAKRGAAGAYQDLLEREGRAEFDRTTGRNNADSDRLGRLDPNDVVAPSTPGRVNPTQTTDHAAAGLKRTGPNTYIGPNGTYWHRTSNGTFAKGKG